MKARFWFGETTKLNQNGTIFGWKVLYSKGKNSWKSFQQFGLNERKETNYFSKRSYWEVKEVKEVKDGKEEIAKLDWESFLKEEERKLSEKQRKQIRELKEGIARVVVSVIVVINVIVVIVVINVIVVTVVGVVGVVDVVRRGR